MCLILFAYNYHPDYLLILAANRDEYYARPTAPAHFWKENKSILAGKDLKQSGTWLGISKSGHFGAITNYRSPDLTRKNTVSRGLLVKEYLYSSENPLRYLTELGKIKNQYNPFNLLLMEEMLMWYYSNQTGHIEKIRPGIHGLSNHLLGTPWPKVVKGKESLFQSLQSNTKVSTENLFAILSDKQQAKDEELPHTGVPIKWERLLSPIFIQSKDYGTRASTVLLIRRDNHVKFCERSFGPYGRYIGSVFHEFYSHKF